MTVSSRATARSRVSVWYALSLRRGAGKGPTERVEGTTAFFLVLFAVLAAGIAFTPQATGPHNIFLLWPLPAVLAVCLLACAFAIPSAGLRRSVTAVLCVGVAALLATQVRAGVSYVDAYRSDRQWNAPWSPEIYTAARAVERSAAGVRSIIAADWGLGTQVFGLGNEAVRARFSDVWPAFTGASANPAALANEWFRGSVIVVFHTKVGEIMPLSTEHVEAVLKGLGARVQPLYVGRQIRAVIVAG